MFCQTINKGGTERTHAKDDSAILTAMEQIIENGHFLQARDVLVPLRMVRGLKPAHDLLAVQYLNTAGISSFNGYRLSKDDGNGVMSFKGGDPVYKDGTHRNIKADHHRLSIPPIYFHGSSILRLADERSKISPSQIFFGQHPYSALL